MISSRILAPVVCVLLTTLVALWQPSLVVDADRRVYDSLVRAGLATDGEPRVAVVAIDEASLAERGQWPWPRDVIAALVERLAAMGAQAIAFDVLFPEADRSRASDQALAEAFARAPVVASYAFAFDSARASGDCALHPLRLAFRQASAEAQQDRLFRADGVVCNLGALTGAASSSGFINATPDADGMLRRYPLAIRYRDRVYPSLALAAARRAVGDDALLMEERGDGSLALTVGARRITTDDQGRLLVRYAGRPVRYLPATDVLSGSAAAEAIRGRVVFVGATALGLRDTIATPVNRAMPGVEVHATIAESLLAGPAIDRVEFASVYELLLAVAAGLVVILISAKYGLLAGGAAAVAVAGLAWWGALWLLRGGLFVSPFYVLLAVGMGLVLDGVASLTRERRRGDHEERRRAEAQRLIVQALTSLTETRDTDTGRHARRTQQYTRVLATALSRRPGYQLALTPERIELISTLAPLHDIGKVGVSDSVLRKPGALTAEEQVEMRRHPGLGHDSLLKAERLAGVYDNEVLVVAKEIVHTHHEFWDGSGYPRGLQGEQIPISGRIVALVDMYDAMVKERAYRKAVTPEEAARAIIAQRGQHFDPEIVDAFAGVQREFADLAGQTDLAD